MPDEDIAKDFDVAVSFAGEQRAYVEAVVRGLDDSLTVFYDADYRVETWGEDLVDFFTNLYQHRTRYVVIFSSVAYRDKEWTNLERRSALATAVRQRGAYVLPVKLEDVELPGLLPTTGYLDARHEGLNGVIAAIHQKLRAHRTTTSPPEYRARVPQNDKDVELLLALRPEWWEYWLYAGLLKLGVAALEGKYLDYEMGFAKQSGRSFIGRDAFDFLQPATDQASALIDSLMAVLNSNVQARAFGEPGEAGDPDRITHIAQRFIDVYEGLMDEAARIRAVAVPPAFRRAQGAAARFGSNAVEEIREFVLEIERTVQELPELSEAHKDDSEPLEIRLVCTVTADERAGREFVLGLKEGLESLSEDR